MFKELLTSCASASILVMALFSPQYLSSVTQEVNTRIIIMTSGIELARWVKFISDFGIRLIASPLTKQRSFQASPRLPKSGRPNVEERSLQLI